MTETEKRRWRVLNEDTIETLNKEYNEFIVFLAKHVKSTSIFIVLLVTAVTSHVLADWLFTVSKATVPTAFFLTAVGFVCLVMDGLWLLGMVVPWRKAARWYNRRYAEMRAREANVQGEPEDE